MNTRTKLATWVDSYLTDRRHAGFALKVEGAQLMRFVRFAEQIGHQGALTTQLASMGQQFPKWEVADGSLRPYPNAEWNAWRNARKDEITPNDHWVCVQSVVADRRGSLWVIDPAAPARRRHCSRRTETGADRPC